MCARPGQPPEPVLVTTGTGAPNVKPRWLSSWAHHLTGVGFHPTIGQHLKKQSTTQMRNLYILLSVLLGTVTIIKQGWLIIIKINQLLLFRSSLCWQDSRRTCCQCFWSGSSFCTSLWIASILSRVWLCLWASVPAVLLLLLSLLSWQTSLYWGCIGSSSSYHSLCRSLVWRNSVPSDIWGTFQDVRLPDWVAIFWSEGSEETKD